MFDADYELILVRDIEVQHLRAPPGPVLRRAHVAYIPNEKGQITGLSKLASWWTSTLGGRRYRSG